ncbi:MAG: hypothetical protein MUC48_06065 [Leptolyngbya sp. Prado105]|jgi:hypothetical protein|nr:hypothetical protein [Leptolyngbya sp. Prado105]
MIDKTSPVLDAELPFKPSVPKPEPPARKRLNLDLSQEAYDLLQDLARDTGKNMAEILRTGLALYGIANEEKTIGRRLGVVEGERVIKEILLP